MKNAAGVARINSETPTPFRDGVIRQSV